MGMKRKRRKEKNWKKFGQPGNIIAIYNKSEIFKIEIFRSYFKSVDKHRSESMSAVPRMKLRAEEESVNPGSQMSKFAPKMIR